MRHPCSFAGRVFCSLLIATLTSVGGAAPLPAPQLVPAKPVVTFRPPLAERCANKDDRRGLAEAGTDLWGLRLSGARGGIALPLFQQASLDGVQLIDGRTVKVVLRGARLIPEAASVAAEAAATTVSASLVGAIITAKTPGGGSVLRLGLPVTTLLKECPERFVAETTMGLGDGETCRLRAIKPARILLHNKSAPRPR